MKRDFMKRNFIRAAGMFALLVFLLFGVSGMEDVHAAAGGSITVCQINEDLNTITVTGSMSALPASDDGVAYLFAEPTFSGGITTTHIASVPLAKNLTFTTDLLQGQTGSRLYSKFVIATKQGGKFVPVSNFCYLTNPQILATHTTPRVPVTSKKGLIPDPSRLGTGELADLGVQHITYNIPVSYILGPTTNANYPTINYEYNGKTYQFNGLAVAEYDNVFRQMEAQNISVTAVLLNNYNPEYAFLLHPLSRDGTQAPYYAFNASTQTGCEYLAAIGSFLGSRYSGTGHGNVDNWIIGNEVPAREQWNYIQNMSLEAYVEEYAKALRIFFTAIKSENANARVFTSVDQVWDTNKNYSFRYDVKDFLTALNGNICAQGNFSWGIACHPYPVPLTYAPWWTGTAYYRNLVKHNENSPYLTMENIEVLTDYLSQPSMLTPAQQVRPIIINEVGYTSAQGEAYQAAAFVYGYLQAERNQHIDAFIINSQLDHPAEIAQGLLLGIQNVDGSHKMVYDYFKYIDTENAAPYMEAARNLIGIPAWSSVLTPR